ncbi:MAG: PspC domain-containing protein [Bacteroidales bacterium]
MEKRLYKSKDKKIAGVCGGIADYLGVDPTVIRVAFALLVIFTGFVPGIIAYVLMAIIIPDQN